MRKTGVKVRDRRALMMWAKGRGLSCRRSMKSHWTQEYTNGYRDSQSKRKKRNKKERHQSQAISKSKWENNRFQGLGIILWARRLHPPGLQLCSWNHSSFSGRIACACNLVILSSFFMPVGIWESHLLLLFPIPVSFLVQIGSISAGTKFSYALCISHVCHMDLLLDKKVLP